MKKALVADDTKNIRMMLKICLESEGYEVSTAENGSAAYDMIMNSTFDIAFLDIKMPETSGTQVLKQVRSQGNNTPIIIITAFATIKNAIECTRYGATAYLQKPFTPNKIRVLLKELSDSSSFKICNEEDLLKNTDLRELLREYLKMLPEASDSADLYNKIGEIYLQLGEEDKAEKYFACSKIFI